MTSSSSSPATPRGSSTPITPRWRSSRAHSCARRRRMAAPSSSDAHPLAPLDTHLPRTEAARDGRLVTVANAAVYQRDHPDLLADVRHDGTASVAAVPLLDPTGATFGVLDLGWREERLFTDADDVRLTTLGALVAGTLQRVDAEQAEVRRAEQLAAFAERLSIAATAAEVRHAVAADAAALLGADVVSCALLDASGALDDGGPVDDADEPAVTAAVDLALAGEDVASVADGAGRLTFAAVPLRAGQAVRGVMRASWRTPVALDARSQATLRTVAELAAQALVRAQATDASVRHADGLAKLAEELATATTLEQVAAAASDYLPTISDAADVRVDRRRGGRGRRRAAPPHRHLRRHGRRARRRVAGGGDARRRATGAPAHGHRADRGHRAAGRHPALDEPDVAVAAPAPAAAAAVATRPRPRRPLPPDRPAARDGRRLVRRHRAPRRHRRHRHRRRRRSRHPGDRHDDPPQHDPRWPGALRDAARRGDRPDQRHARRRRHGRHRPGHRPRSGPVDPQPRQRRPPATVAARSVGHGGAGADGDPAAARRGRWRR